MFEELFTLSAGLALLRQRRSGGEGPAFPACDPADFYALLPFAPTEAQRRTIDVYKRQGGKRAPFPGVFLPLFQKGGPAGGPVSTGLKIKYVVISDCIVGFYPSKPTKW